MAASKTPVQGEVQNETVTVMLPVDRETQEDKVVWINSKRYIIKRGEPVAVPKDVAEVLAHEDRMIMMQYEYDQKKRR